MIRRRHLLQATAGILAAPALVEKVGAQTAFDWKQAKGKVQEEWGKLTDDYLDQIAGNELSRTGDLAPANVRLAQRGALIERRSISTIVATHQPELARRLGGSVIHLVDGAARIVEMFAAEHERILPRRREMPPRRLPLCLFCCRPSQATTMSTWRARS